MLRPARYPRPGVPGDGGAAAVLLWRALRSRALRTALLVPLLAFFPAVALWTRATVPPVALPSAPVAVAAGPGGHADVATSDGQVWALGGGALRAIGAVAGVPLALAADPHSGWAYVATAGAVTALGAPGAGWRVAMPPGEEPAALALDPALERLYVAARAVAGEPAHGRLLAVDARTGGVAAAVPVGAGLSGLAVDARTHRVYVADPVAGTVVALAGDPLAIRATIAVGGAPDRLAVDERADRVYLTDSAAGALAAIDERTDAVAETVALGIHPTAVAADPATGRLFAAAGGLGVIAVLGGDGAPLAALRAGAWPFDLVADPAGGRLYAIDGIDRGVWRIEDRPFWGTTTRLVAIAVTAPAGTADGEQPGPRSGPPPAPWRALPLGAGRPASARA